MSLGIFYWVILIVAIVFGTWANRGTDGKFNVSGLGGSLVLIVLLAILEWAVFGSPVAGK